MTRINTNVSSLVAQNRLKQTNGDLQQSLTRLSTGLRINTGKDDPAGLIASEALRSDITAFNKAITNTQRASQIIATADSALGQVSSLLNDIRGLVVEAANTGALSDDEIAANQLQVDSSLEAINRIAQTTTFQGRKLLDGSLDFVSNANTNAAVTDSRIDQANLGATGSVSVDVEIEAAAAKAELNNTSLTLTQATAEIGFAARGTIGTDITLVADTNSADFDNITVSFAYDAGLSTNEVGVAWDADTNTLTITGNEASAGNITRGDIADAINAQVGDLFTATAATAGGAGGDFTSGGTPEVDRTLVRPIITVTAADPGVDFNEVSIEFADVNATAESAVYDAGTKTLTLSYDADTDTFSNIATEIATLAEFSASADAGGTLVGLAGDTAVTGDTGFTGGGQLAQDVVFELVGSLGAETFNLVAGTTGQQLAAAINLVSDATGVAASYDDTDGSLVFSSSEYGSDSLVAVNVKSEGTGGTFESSLDGIRATGVDIDARVNGVRADGKGNQLSINTSTLDLSLTLDPAQSVSSLSFTISGGGALFQLGGDVVSNQQARLGIGSVSTSSLGGASGSLYELGSGQSKSLTADTTGAAKVIDEVINKVTSLRARLGAFQSTTLESNLVSLNDTVVNLTEAESSIRDADFAAESAKLTRAQILVQSGTSVLGIANQNPQNVLSLLR